MPHQCTDCGRSFADGSTEMLSGCPDCGGTTFQYRPEGADNSADPVDAPDPPEQPVEGSVARTVGNAATAVRDFVGGGPSPEDPVGGGPSPEDPVGAGNPPEAGDTAADASVDATGHASAEDAAQASARSEVVSREELPSASDATVTERPTPVLDEDSESHDRGGDDTAERPDLQTLREELNDQFESIKVLEPGQYELNLMELYDREEYIIALQEDGKYTIQVPERWRGE